MDILHEIAERARARVEEKKRLLPFEAVAEAALAAAQVTAAAASPLYPFEAAIRSSEDIAFICEIKKASPSKGVIAGEFPYLDIAADYTRAGAAAISVLTEPFYFKGDDRFLSEIAAASPTPLLRKDFVVDEYMIYEAKTLGAAAVLLICAILDAAALARHIAAARSLGLSALVETHDAREIEMALAAGAGIVGVNNRDLKTFEVDITLSERLRERVPPGVLFVSESGIGSPDDIERLRRIGADAALIGESFMRSGDKRAELARLRGAPEVL